jgi:hypothetical protein
VQLIEKTYLNDPFKAWVLGSSPSALTIDSERLTPNAISNSQTNPGTLGQRGEFNCRCWFSAASTSPLVTIISIVALVAVSNQRAHETHLFNWITVGRCIKCWSSPTMINAGFSR